ncbi:podocalyxin isoform X2 [Narcine bancroftii]|uniref:podocalyxin isoform X2 n=1 Tax=Narcine bancroftii TaxID=1343680 RepID=UPI0038312B84
MRSLLRLGVLGFWSFINADTNTMSTIMTNTAVSPMTDSNQIHSTSLSPGNILRTSTAFSNMTSNQVSVVNGLTSTPTLLPITTQRLKQTEMTKNVGTTASQHQSSTHFIALSKSDRQATTITRDIANGAALGSTSAGIAENTRTTAATDREATTTTLKLMEVSSSQVAPVGSTGPKESSSQTPTEQISVTFAKIQNASSARTNPTPLTGDTKNANVQTSTFMSFKVQMPLANKTTDSDMNVKNTVENSSDVTGSVNEGALQSGTTDVAQMSTMSNIATGDLKKKADKFEGNDVILSEAYCVADSRNQNYSLIVMKSMDCETFASSIGKYLAKKVCSELAKNADLQLFDKCEVQYSPVKDEQNKMTIDVAFKVTDAWMNNILEKVKKESEDLKKGDEDRKEQQRATELKKLIAMVVTGSLLLLVIMSAIIYRCSQRKSKHKDPYLTEELRTVDNGCHDNPAMDITDRESEMEEKSNSKATFLENTDGWIVPMDTHIKDDLEEEDTHL